MKVEHLKNIAQNPKGFSQN